MYYVVLIFFFSRFDSLSYQQWHMQDMFQIHTMGMNTQIAYVPTSSHICLHATSTMDQVQNFPISSHMLSTGQSYTHLWHSQLSYSSSA